MKAKKIFIIIILLFTVGYLLFTAYETNAQYELEIDYPILPIGGDADPATGLVGYLRYIYLFGLALIGVVGLGALVYGGFMYMLSGTVTTKEEAKKQIWGAIAGLILALSAYLILNTINPDLVKFRLPETESQIESIERFS